VGYSAVASVNHLVDQYRRYLRTSFRFLDPKLLAQFEDHLAGSGVVVKGPLVTLARDYLLGKTLAELVQEGVADPGLLGLKWSFGNNPLFSHQEKALRLGVEGRGFVVATGTGSGKTEAFLLPLISGILQSRKKGASPKGVRAIILYPMNALALDQLKRLRELFADDISPVTFGLYTGDSEGTSSKLGVSSPVTERIKREDFQKNPPDILLTNYKELEFLLVRKKDRPLFGPSLKYLVLDEMHSYRGALATEMACLIRRLKTRCGLKHGQLQGIGTSATVDVAADGGCGLSKFAGDLFGEAMDETALVREDYAERPRSLHPYTPGLPELTDGEIRALDPADGKAVRELVTKLTGKFCPDGETGLAMAEALEGNRVVEVLEASCSKQPVSLDEVVKAVQAQIPERAGLPKEEVRRELEAYLLAGSAVSSETDRPRLRPKLHLFFHGVYDVSLCLNPECRSLVPQGGNRCHKCGSAARPAAICRTCGQDFVKVRFHSPQDENPEGTGDFFSDETTGFLAYKLHPLDGEDVEPGDDEEDGPKRRHASNTVGEPASVCPDCGRVMKKGKTCPEHGKGVPYTLWHWVGKARPKQGVLHTCPNCGDKYLKGDIVTPLRTPTAATTSTLIMHQLDKLEGADRKILVFADNRQNVAHQAGYTEDHYRVLGLRRALAKVVWHDGTRRDWVYLKGEMPQRAFDIYIQLGIVYAKSTEQEKEKWKQALQYQAAIEFSAPLRRRSSLEGLGLADVGYEFLDELLQDDAFTKICAQAGLEQNRGLLLVRALLDFMRHKRAMAFPFFQHFINPDRNADYRQLQDDCGVRFSEYQRNPVGFSMDKRPTGLSQILGFVGEGKGNRPGAMSLAAKVIGDGGLAKNFLESVVPLLQKGDRPLLNHIRDFYLPKAAKSAGLRILQIDPELIRVRKPKEMWRCSSCGTWCSYDLGCCPKPTCDGHLVPAKQDENDYYMNLYLKVEPKRLRVKEHSAQITPERRAEREADFKEGKLEGLICTPTLEMGVDIGSLLTVALRGAPPSASNYAQRVGRAGRRLRIGFAATFCTGGAHDRHAFEEPEWLVAGRFSPQRLKLENPRIVRRHMHSFILESLTHELPGLMREFLDDEKHPTRWKPEVLEELLNELKSRREEIKHGLIALFEGDQEKKLTEHLGPEWAQKILDEFEDNISGRLESWWKRVEQLVREFDLYSTVGSKKQDNRLAQARQFAYRELTSDPNAAYPLSYFSAQGLLPAYQFPQDTFSLDPGMDGTPTLRRPAAIALEEFAPGNFVYANGRKLKSIRALYAGGPGTVPGRTGRSDAETSGRLVSYTFCPVCGEATEKSRNECLRCKAPLTTGSKGVLFADTFEAEEQLAIGSDEESRQRKSFDKRENLIADGDADVELFRYFGAPVELHRQATLLITNWGNVRNRNSGGNGFNLCVDCGRHLPYDPHDDKAQDDIRRWNEWHSKLGCAGSVESFVLGYKFETDCLVLSLPMPKDAQPQGRINRSPELVTLTEALLLGAVDLLEIESHELAAFSRLSPDADTPAEIVIYETVPGGAGYLDVLASRLPEVARIAMKRLYEHKCGGACYLCLKHYYNQYLHALLNKENIRWMLQALGDMAPASAENAKRGMAAKILNEDCRSRSAGVFATGRRPGTKGPQSPIEERLLVALRKVEGLPEPEAQFEVLKDGAPYTIPDFAYPDRKIAVFCDGYLFHGTPGTLELDAEKRNRLQVEGWKVLVFWGASINQNADVCARQVKQCWDVSLPLDAKTGRKN
jgi:ATP-dependent helicase YprA (DUF1998 family)